MLWNWSYPGWVLGTRLRSTGKAASVNHFASSPAHGLRILRSCYWARCRGTPVISALKRLWEIAYLRLAWASEILGKKRKAEQKNTGGGLCVETQSVMGCLWHAHKPSRALHAGATECVGLGRCLRAEAGSLALVTSPLGQ